MLCLKLHPGDVVTVGPDIHVKVGAIRGASIKLEIDAPRGLHIGRVAPETTTTDPAIRHRAAIANLDAHRTALRKRGDA